MKLKVHFLRDLPSEILDGFRKELNPDIEFTAGTEVPSPAEYQILIADMPRKAHLAASPDLHTLIIPYTGIPEETLALMKNFPHISVHNSHFPAGSTAEMAVALLLAAARFLIRADKTIRTSDWTMRYDPPAGVSLEGKTILILGYGEIGRRVGRVCHAMGMNIIATRRNTGISAPADAPVKIYPPSELNRLLPKANVLMVTLPLTSETTGLIGEEELKLLPQKAILVNVGRGPIVDEKALYEALASGRLMAAGIDVWYNYPTDALSRKNTQPSLYPFHKLDNVVMCPHLGGLTIESMEQRTGHLAAMLNTAANGETMPNKTNLNTGY